MRWSLHIVLQLSTFSGSLALYNVTVDDNGADPVSDNLFRYTSGWNYGPDCSGCEAQPDPTATYDQTWHDSTWFPTASETVTAPPNATFEFTGSAIYVYGILPSSTNPITNVDILFYIDDEQAGAFQSATTYKNAYSYNFPLYSNDSLSYATHTFRLQNGRVGGDLSVVLLDYIVYSTNEEATSSSTTTSSTVPNIPSSLSLSLSQSSDSPLPPDTSSQHTGTSAHGLSHSQILLLAILLPIVGLLLILLGFAYIVHRLRSVSTPLIHLMHSPLMTSGSDQGDAPASQQRENGGANPPATARLLEMREADEGLVRAQSRASIARATIGAQSSTSSLDRHAGMPISAQQLAAEEQRRRGKIEQEFRRFRGTARGATSGGL